MAKYCYDFPRPMVTVDTILFAWLKDALTVLLVKRKQDPYRGRWAIPGGFVEEDETLEKAAVRELEEETGLGKIYPEQLYTFGDPGRDPRGRTITVVYLALVQPDSIPSSVRAGSDAAAAQWFPVYQLPRVAFDHRMILSHALEELRNKLRYTTKGFQLLSRKFTLTDLQEVYEAILNKRLDKRRFRKKIVSLNILQRLPAQKKRLSQGAPQLYTLSRQRFSKLKEEADIFPF